jgi:hypothetical protein
MVHCLRVRRNRAAGVDEPAVALDLATVKHHTRHLHDAVFDGVEPGGFDVDGDHRQVVHERIRGELLGRATARGAHQVRDAWVMTPSRETTSRVRAGPHCC